MPRQIVNSLFKDYAREPVPEKEGRSGWHIGLIYIGVGLALPAFVIGAQIGLGLGLYDALLATLLAGLVLAAVGSMTGWIGGCMRLSTYMLSQITFGRQGAKLINLLMTATLFGWFGVTIALFGQAVNGLMVNEFSINLTEAGWIIIGGVLMVSTAIWGFKGLDKLSLVAVPLITVLLLWAGYNAVSTVGWTAITTAPANGELPFGVAVSMLVGSWMVGAAVLPDLARYGRRPVDGSFGAVLCFLPGLLAIMALSMVPALAAGETDIIAALGQFGWPLLSTLVLVLAAWSSNDNNLYSASLGLSALIPKVAKWKITLAAGAVGTGLALLGIMDNLVAFLIFLGVFVPPVAGVYVADYIIRKRKTYRYENIGKADAFRWSALIAWALGSFVALAAQPADLYGLGWTDLTGIAAVDGLMVGAIIMTFVDVAQNHKEEKS